MAWLLKGEKTKEVKEAKKEQKETPLCWLIDYKRAKNEQTIYGTRRGK
jgi:hypothetical protein